MMRRMMEGKKVNGQKIIITWQGIFPHSIVERLGVHFFLLDFPLGAIHPVETILHKYAIFHQDINIRGIYTIPLW